MSLEHLLSPSTAPLKTLSLDRYSISPLESVPHEIILSNDQELLFYPLIGRARCVIDKQYDLVLGGRGSVREPAAGAIRLAPGAWYVDVYPIDREPVDFLLVRRDARADTAHEAKVSAIFCPEHAWLRRQVGAGTHQRMVADLVQPTGYHIAAGETLNVPGAWSSHPAHATEKDKQRLLAGDVTWEECFFVICPGYGIIHLDGLYHDGKQVQETRQVRNGEALVTPLGSHPIVASPGDWLWYAWFFTGTALQKTYNTKATDVKTYVK